MGGGIRLPALLQYWLPTQTLKEENSWLARPISSTVMTAGVWTSEDTPSFNHQFVTGENESMLIRLRAALGLALLGVGRPGRN